MASAWDPAIIWKQGLKLFRSSPDSQVQVQEIPSGSQEPVAAADGFPTSGMLITLGIGAIGGAAVAVAAYGLPVRNRVCPACGCPCCGCYVPPGVAIRDIFKRIAAALDAGRERIQHVVGMVPKVAEDNNNGSWTCIQVSRDDETSTTVVEEAPESKLDSQLNAPDPFSSAKRKGYLSWDDYFMSIAFLSAQRSKDPIRQVGACLVSQDHVILGIGYNGFPRGCSDDKLPWAKKSKDGDPLKTKYPYVCHAEVNAILNKNHATAAGQRLYVTMFPCNECAKIIIQAGIVEVIFYTEKPAHTDYKFAASRKLLSLANVKVRQHQPKDKSIILKF